MALSMRERGMRGGRKTRDKYGLDYLKQIAAKGRETQKDIYGPDFQRILAQNGHHALRDIYGNDFHSVLGKRGAFSLWQTYTILPVEIGSYALVNRETGVIKALW